LGLRAISGPTQPISNFEPPACPRRSFDDRLMTDKIALAHLTEFPDYYTRLAKMEAEAKSFWDKKHQ
jgi:hypothetical protein